MPTPQSLPDHTPLSAPRRLRRATLARTTRRRVALSRVALSLAALLVAVGGVAGCGSSRALGGPAVPSEATTLRVDNRGFLDMTIYVLRTGQRTRLGVVSGTSRATFRIPDFLVQGVQSLRFQADPIGGRRAPISEEINVRPGDRLDLVIPP